MKNINLYYLAAFSLIAARPLWAGTSQKSFTPTKYIYPIVEIDLINDDGSGGQTLYKCAGGTSATCMVDLADTSGTALKAITASAQNASIAVGTYSQLKIYSCPVNASSKTLTSLTLRGSASVGALGANTTYSTKSTGMSSGGPLGDTSLAWGCGAATINLATPLVVTVGSTQAFSLLFDLTNAAWTDPSATTLSAVSGGACVGGTLGAQGLCAAPPLVVPYYGTGTPTFERYYVAHSNTSPAPALADANAVVSIGVDAGSVFYAGVQPYYSETSPAITSATKGGPDYNAMARAVSTNGDGSLAFQTGAGTWDNHVGFSAFMRSASHTGTCKNEATTAATWYYQAFKQ